MATTYTVEFRDHPLCNMTTESVVNASLYREQVSRSTWIGGDVRILKHVNGKLFVLSGWQPVAK